MVSCVQVPLGERSYSIQVGTDWLDDFGPACRQHGFDGTALVVSDSNVAPLYAGRLEASLNRAGVSSFRAVVPAGERSKSLEMLARLYTAAVNAGLDRRSWVVALGGGVVGDLAGFMAATFLRGLRYVQVPTSLLAMVDSSVGGKTGIDLPEGKNLVGAFHQPSLVWIDVGTLRTLPEVELRAGMAEVVKYGAIRDGALLSMLETRRADILSLTPSVLEEMVARCCQHKADVVAADEREAGVRATLNFGHTLGHALEAVTGYVRWRHGEAVAMGMAFAAELSVRCVGFSAGERDRLVELLRSFRLPTSVRETGVRLRWSDVWAAMTRDKKAARRTPRWVLLTALGQARYGVEVPADVVEEVWRAFGQ
jgi:3-dehydroquinate synthase